MMNELLAGFLVHGHILLDFLILGFACKGKGSTNSILVRYFILLKLLWVCFRPYELLLYFHVIAA